MYNFDYLTMLLYAFNVGRIAFDLHVGVNIHILTAFDKIKDSMPADRACDATLNGALEALGEPLTLTHALLAYGSTLTPGG